MMLGGSGQGPERAAERAGDAPHGKPKPAVLDVYSSGVLDDPYVIEQQLQVVEALELSCRQYGKRCAEAQKARERVEENSAR